MVEICPLVCEEKLVIHDVNGQASVPVKGNEACFISHPIPKQATQSVLYLQKDKCLAAIGERPVEVTDDSKWDEMDGNAIANLHIALTGGVLSSIDEKKSAKEIWDHLA
ncbi:hypothetical protein Tco_0982178 [Tanacetum coccineum]